MMASPGDIAASRALAPVLLNAFGQTITTIVSGSNFSLHLWRGRRRSEVPV